MKPAPDASAIPSLGMSLNLLRLYRQLRRTVPGYRPASHYCRAARVKLARRRPHPDRGTVQ